DTKKKVASYKEVTYDELIPQKDTKKQKHQRSTKDLKILKNNKSITQKLSEILEREMAIIKRDKLQTEIPSQFGLKNNMFELINV
ncbi:complement regulator-acquiring protein, partial [Borreliella valaisiana]